MSGNSLCLLTRLRHYERDGLYLNTLFSLFYASNKIETSRFDISRELQPMKCFGATLYHESIHGSYFVPWEHTW